MTKSYYIVETNALGVKRVWQAESAKDAKIKIYSAYDGCASHCTGSLYEQLENTVDGSFEVFRSILAVKKYLKSTFGFSDAGVTTYINDLY